MYGRKIFALLLCVIIVMGHSSSGMASVYTSTTGGAHALTLSSSSQSAYEDFSVSKTGSVSGQNDNYDWQGTNAAVHASGGGTFTLKNGLISSDASYGNAVFSYGGNLNGSNAGDGTAINISECSITTMSNNSGGIMVTGGGIINADSVEINTYGGSSAAIRSDKGGGTIKVSNMLCTTNGQGSPAIYSTAEIIGSDYVDLTSNKSQVVVIEGGNSVSLKTASLKANHSTKNGQDKTYQAVLIYQSMSGDASDGVSSFTLTDSSLENANGDIFCVTNTTCTITLSEVDIQNNDEDGKFLRAEAQNWGSSGKNGGKVTMNIEKASIIGDIIVDKYSTLKLNISSDTSYTGAVNPSGQTGTVRITLQENSMWELTADSYISSLTNYGYIEQGSYKLYVNGTVYDGTSTTAGSDDLDDSDGGGSSTGSGVSITTASLKDATVGKSYSASLKAAGKKPLTWTASNLPDGLTFSEKGKLSGKPAVSGTYRISFTASNSTGSSTKTLSLKVSDVAPKIKVSSKPGIVGEPYSLALGLSAGTGTITWTLSGGLPSGLEFDAENAVISGEPSEAWNKKVTVTAENSAGKAAKEFKLSIKAVKPSINTKALASGVISVDYEASFDITGTSPIKVTVTGLPDGLTYNADTGEITGIPKKHGKFSVKLIAQNAAGKASKNYKVMIYAPPSISAANLAQATAGKSYTAKFNASGTNPITWSVSDGTLPDGISLNAKTGALKGKAALDGSYDITVTAENGSGSDSESVTLIVKAVAPKLSGNIKRGTAGKAYSSSLKVKGTAPIVWSVSGDLPDGITFSDGTFSGTSARYFKGKVVVTVSHGALSDSGTYTLEIRAVAPKITTKTLVSGTQGQAYNAVLEATGTPDIKWSWSGYPAGLTLDADTGQISGTPAKAGNYKPKVTAKNDAKSVSKTIRLVIDEASDNASAREPESGELQSETAEYYGTTEELPEGFVIAAELPEVSVDVSGQYDFAVSLMESAPIGAKLFWIANSEKPSDDDAIADFFDAEGQEIESVPANREVVVSAWLNEGIVYRPVIAVKLSE